MSWFTTALLLALSTAIDAKRWQRTCCKLPLGFDPVVAVTQAKRLTHLSSGRDYGILTEAMLELYNPEYTVFSELAFPYGVPPILDFRDKVQGLTWAWDHTITGNGSTRLREDAEGATHGSASFGSAAVMMGQKKPYFMDAAVRQFEYFNTVPRWENGAYSSAEAHAELSADWVYNVPPFFAYYGVATADVKSVQLAVEQCRLYRQVLRTSTGLWQHIVGPKAKDHGLWSTGNGWAAAGMVKVLAVTAHWSSTNPDEKVAIADLFTWIGEILRGAMQSSKEAKTGLLRNYLDDTTSFGETTGTSLLAATVYRLAVLKNELRWVFDEGVRGSDGVPVKDPVDPSMLSWADESLSAVASHVSTNGTAAPVVKDRAPCMDGSPEGQSALIMLYAAYRDCIDSGICGDPSKNPAWSPTNCRAKSEHFICRELPVEQWSEKESL